MKLKVIIGLCALLAVITACQSNEQQEFDRYYTAGNVLYQKHCQNCHGNQGQGLNALIPALSDSTYLKNNKSTLACSIKYGLKGDISVNGKPFNGAMPANNLPSIDMAEILTYVTNSFGNKLGVVTADEIDVDLTKCK